MPYKLITIPVVICMIRRRSNLFAAIVKELALRSVLHHEKVKQMRHGGKPPLGKNNMYGEIMIISRQISLDFQ